MEKENALFLVICKNDIFVRSLVTFKGIKIEDRGLKPFLENKKSFHTFFEKLKSVEKQPRYNPLKVVL